MDTEEKLQTAVHRVEDLAKELKWGAHRGHPDNPSSNSNYLANIALNVIPTTIQEDE